MLLRFLCRRALCVFQGELGPSGAPGTPGKEGLFGPKVIAVELFFNSLTIHVSNAKCFLCLVRATADLTAWRDPRELRERKVNG